MLLSRWPGFTSFNWNDNPYIILKQQLLFLLKYFNKALTFKKKSLTSHLFLVKGG